MILRKIIEDGKTKYEEISFEDALKYENKNELVFTDEDEQDEFEERLDELDELDDDIDDDSHINFTFNQKSNNKKNRNKITCMLPFLDKESLKEIVDGIINEEEEYKDLNLIVLFPFIGKDECDRLFKKFIFENKERDKNYIVKIAPFVSRNTLSNFVDEYVNGKYQNVNVDPLYPFMSSYDVKRIFKYIISKKEQ